MGIRYEDQCVGCTSMGLPCMGSICKNKDVPIWYCDKCEEECVDLYEVDGYEVCESCALKMLPKVHEE